MLKKRLIPKLQMVTTDMAGQERLILVTTRLFNEVIPVGDPVSQAKIYESQAADELIFIDIRPDVKHKPLMLQLLRKLTAEIFMPITIGGGITSTDDIRLFLSHGADKVTINSEAVRNPSLLTVAGKKFGAQCIVVSIDYKYAANGIPEVYINGGTTGTSLHPIEWALECERLGAGEILLTCIDRDGMSQGLDVDLSAKLSVKLNIPLIVGGGCGIASHFIDGFLIGKADAITAGTYFCFRDQNPIQTRSHINNAGIPIRLHQ